ncbi:hypothetical protein VTN77DRAFT_8917 [Rasamsonia byssochlamydoides]|uniref:uncharacterized protein n=1 Tax=Rasamsonia byssochlamydoides TaxID=89139 RepID=UPI0037438AFC
MAREVHRDEHDGCSCSRSSWNRRSPSPLQTVVLPAIRHAAIGRFRHWQIVEMGKRGPYLSLLHMGRVFAERNTRGKQQARSIGHPEYEPGQTIVNSSDSFPRISVILSFEMKFFVAIIVDCCTTVRLCYRHGGMMSHVVEEQPCDGELAMEGNDATDGTVPELEPTYESSPQ